MPSLIRASAVSRQRNASSELFCRNLFHRFRIFKLILGRQPGFIYLFFFLCQVFMFIRTPAARIRKTQRPFPCVVTLPTA